MSDEAADKAITGDWPRLKDDSYMSLFVRAEHAERMADSWKDKYTRADYEITELRRLNVVLSANQKWRSIDEAPKDGMHILCYCGEDSDNTYMEILNFDPKRKVWFDGEIREWDGPEPTHFMYLPESPTTPPMEAPRG